jgi:hypothetical protein
VSSLAGQCLAARFKELNAVYAFIQAILGVVSDRRVEMLWFVLQIVIVAAVSTVFDCERVDRFDFGLSWRRVTPRFYIVLVRF